MSAICSHLTVIPPENGNKITDHGASQHGFDVYEAYQSALYDEEVSPLVALMSARSVFFHPDTQISPPLAAILSLTELITRSDGKSGYPKAFHDTSRSRPQRAQCPSSFELSTMVLKL
jgi:hypothetical protein